MSLTEFLRRFMRPLSIETSRPNDSRGSARRTRRIRVSYTGPLLESLEDRTLLAAVAWNDSYMIEAGTSLRTGGFVAADRLVTEYDASALTGLANGVAVSTWNDVSGNGNTANAVQPGTFVANGVGGRPAVGFNLHNNYLSVQSVGSIYGIQGDASWTMVWVANVPVTAPGTRSIGAIGTGGGVRTSAIVELESSRLDVAGGFAHDVILNPSNSFSQFVGEDVILTFRHEGNTGQSMLSTTSIFVNGFSPGEGPLSGYSLAATGQGATLPFQIADRQITLGGGSVSVTPGFVGMLSEMHLYNDSLSDDDLQHVEYSLGQKYGIAGGFQAPSILGLLDNDAPDGGLLSAVLVTAPAHGTLTLDADGSVLYAPNPGFTGVDTFTYKVNDGTLDSNIATATINVGVGTGSPFVGSLTAGPDPVFQGADLTLEANGVGDSDGTVTNVTFYWDTNANGALDIGTDLLLGVDADGVDGWSITAAVTGIPAGAQTFLAQAEDATSLTSNVAATSIQVDPGVYWDGGGGDLQWSNSLNWSGNLLPGASDDVVISVPGDITVTHNGLVTTVHSLMSEESILINGGSLKVTASSFINGQFTIAANSTFTVDGLTASLSAQNTTSLGLGNLFAQNGGVLDLSAVATALNGFDGQTIWRATGAGSRIDLSGLTTLAGYGRNGQLIIDAIDGAEVDLSGVIDNTYGTTQITALGAGSVVDHSSMTSWRDENRQRSSFVKWGNGGIVQLDVLETMYSVGITANTGDTLTIPSLTNISGVDDSAATFLADGIGSRIELPAVTTMDGSDRHGQIDLLARNGGVIDLPLLAANTSGTT